MNYSIRIDSVEKLRVGCLIVGIFADKELSDSAKKLNEHGDKFISKLTRRGDISGKKGQTSLIHNIAQQFPNIAAQRILLVGLGKKSEFDERAYEAATNAAYNALKNSASKDAFCSLVELPVKGRDLCWKIRQAVITHQATGYSCNEFKSKTDDEEPALKTLHFKADNNDDLVLCETAIDEGQSIAFGMALSKDLGNSPGNACTPTYLAEQAKKLAKTYKTLKCKVLEEAAMEKLGMGSLLSVSRGSEEPAKLITLHYQNNGNEQPIALVGKGVTFDAGGISLKPGAAMDEMKYDMMGAATVFGVIKAIAELELPINVVGVIPATENLPDGRATKPGDIVTSMSGQTIEILNTDAEGRLILCDALTYCEQFKPSQVIDIATLTGAMVVALGHYYTGIFSNNEALQGALIDAGRQSNDIAWPMPLDSLYDEELKSNFADMANIGSRWGGSCIAASFLARYCKDYCWAHMDIAGTAWKSGSEKGATGRPIPLLVQHLINQSQTNETS